MLSKRYNDIFNRLEKLEAERTRMPSTANLVAMSGDERKAAWKRMEYPPGHEGAAVVEPRQK